MTEENTDIEKTKRTPTQLLIEALEHAEDMEECMVLFRLKPDMSGLGGVGWATVYRTLPEKFAFLEEVKLAMFHNQHHDRGDE